MNLKDMDRFALRKKREDLYADLFAVDAEITRRDRDAAQAQQRERDTLLGLNGNGPWLGRGQ